MADKPSDAVSLDQIARELDKAIADSLHGIGEYARQTMDANPEMAMGLRGLESARRLLSALCASQAVPPDEHANAGWAEAARWQASARSSALLAKDLKAQLEELRASQAVSPPAHDPLCSEGVRAGDQVMSCDCLAGEASTPGEEP